VPLFEHPERGMLSSDVVHYIEGELGQRLVISIPETETAETAEGIQQAAEAEFKKPVLMITHNITFMKAVRLSPNETAAVIKRSEENDEQVTREIEERHRESYEREVQQSDHQDSGSGPGVCEDGGGGAGTEGGGSSEGDSAAVPADEEGNEEGVEDVEGGERRSEASAGTETGSN
jgi:hypothetical protein